MKNKLYTILILIASSAAATAAVVSYPTLNTSLVTYGGVEGRDTKSVSVPISTSPDHTWIDPNVDNPALMRPSVYFGGSISFSPADGGSWASSVSYALQIGGTNVVTLTSGLSVDGWRFSGDSTTRDIEGYPRANSFDFVIKIEDAGWNSARAKIFLGENANSATEGTEDYIVNVTNRTSAPIDNILFTSMTESWASADTSSIATLNYAFSSTEWTPVSAVPEPSHYAAILAVAALAYGYVRRRK